MPLTADLHIGKKGDNAFNWKGNLAENQENIGLCVQFKDTGKASNFYETVEKCIKKLKSLATL